MLEVAKESLRVRLIFGEDCPLLILSLASSALRSCAGKRMDEGKAASASVQRTAIPRGPNVHFDKILVFIMHSYHLNVTS